MGLGGYIIDSDWPPLRVEKLVCTAAFDRITRGGLVSVNNNNHKTASEGIKCPPHTAAAG